MDKIDVIRESITRLYKTNPHIHISVNMIRPKLNIDNQSAVITGVYANLFRIEENSLGFRRYHSIQYSALLIGQVKIAELE